MISDSNGCYGDNTLSNVMESERVEDGQEGHV